MLNTQYTRFHGCKPRELTRLLCTQVSKANIINNKAVRPTALLSNQQAAGHLGSIFLTWCLLNSTAFQVVWVTLRIINYTIFGSHLHQNAVNVCYRAHWAWTWHQLWQRQRELFKPVVLASQPCQTISHCIAAKLLLSGWPYMFFVGALCVCTSAQQGVLHQPCLLSAWVCVCYFSSSSMGL